jgi:hypothetical protein
MPALFRAAVEKRAPSLSVKSRANARRPLPTRLVTGQCFTFGAVGARKLHPPSYARQLGFLRAPTAISTRAKMWHVPHFLKFRILDIEL